MDAILDNGCYCSPLFHCGDLVRNLVLIRIKKIENKENQKIKIKTSCSANSSPDLERELTFLATLSNSFSRPDMRQGINGCYCKTSTKSFYSLCILASFLSALASARSLLSSASMFFLTTSSTFYQKKVIKCNKTSFTR